MNVPTKTLSDGYTIPMIGFGTWKLEEGPECVEAVEYALAHGYRSIDTATAYSNETSVGQGIRNSGLPREDIFVTTKLRNRFHGYDTTMRAFDQSMKWLGLDYLDLYLIHWPGEDTYLDTWKAFVQLQKDGRIRSIGLSNFYPNQIEVLRNETGVMPVSNQIETHPYLHQTEVLDYCAENNILVEAWSPLMAGGEAMADPVVVGLSEKYQKTPAQVILHWHVQNGFRVIPKSKTPSRIVENLNIFDFTFTDDEMAAMNELTKRGKRIGDDPRTYRFKLLAELEAEGLA